jgi:hypothetical protein
MVLGAGRAMVFYGRQMLGAPQDLDAPPVTALVTPATVPAEVAVAEPLAEALVYHLTRLSIDGLRPAPSGRSPCRRRSHARGVRT